MQSYRWIPETGSGLEHLVLGQTNEGIVAQGVVIGGRNGEEFGASYRIACDAAWRIRHVIVDVAGGGHLELFADGDGQWRDAGGASIDALEGCIDVDLTASCFTNTLPIRPLGDSLGERQPIDVAWIWVPELKVERAAQAYTRLGMNSYRYEGLGSGFRADLRVDDDGLVVDYPGLFRRVGS